MYLEENIKGLCSRNGLDFVGFLSDMDVEHVNELSLFDLQAICEEYGHDLYTLLFKPLMKTHHMATKLEKIKLLILDVDGVMTDGGMYFTEKGDEIKRFNTKDGRAIMHLTENKFQVGIISSGFKAEIVEARAKMLGIQHCVVTREKKIAVLKQLLTELNLEMENVAMIGDDVNDIEIMRNIGIAACPSNAVQLIKECSHVILEAKGGEGCVREFIDGYLLKEPLQR